MVKATPAPCSTANQRVTPLKAENGASVAMSATLRRTCQAAALGQASSSRLLPAPLRQGWGGVSARLI